MNQRLTSILLFLSLTVANRAEEPTPAKDEIPKITQELVWPEIKDPQALIDFAKAEIAKAKAKGSAEVYLRGTKLTPVAYLHPTYCQVFTNSPYEQMVIGLERHPSNGQAIIILPFIENLSPKQKEGESFAKIIDTVTPEIKWALMPLALKSCSISEMKSVESITVSVNWRNVQNLDEDKNTWPIPLEMGFPAYPGRMVRSRIMGQATVEFTVTEQGLVSALQVTAVEKEFADAVREAALSWRFEPGVEDRTHLPAATRISMMAEFSLDDGIERPGPVFEVIESLE